MDTTIQLNDEPLSVAVEVDDEAIDDLLAPEMQPALAAGAQFAPQPALGLGHLPAQLFGSLELDRLDPLTHDYVVSRHGVDLRPNETSPLSPLRPGEGN